MPKSRAQQLPACQYGAACTRKGCIYRHPPKPPKASAARASAARAASIMCAGPRAAYELRAQLQVAVRHRCALSDVALASGVAQMKITIDETAAALQKWRYAEQCAARALTRTARLGFCRSVCGT